MDHLELKEDLIRRYSSEYLLNDPAHHIGHVIDVCDLALEINEKMDLGLNKMIIVGAAITHDIFTRYRNIHHVMVRDWLLEANEPWMRHFSAEERQLMAHAAGEHRASYKGEFTSIYSELLSSADRGRPGDIQEMVNRCYIYGRHRLKHTHEEAVARIKPHLMEKFVQLDGSYGRVYPNLWMKMFGEQLAKQSKDIEELDEDSPYYAHLEMTYVTSLYVQTFDKPTGI